MKLRRTHLPTRLLLLAAAAVSVASCNDIDTKRIAQKSATLGDDMYGVFCDRLGASSFTEDLTGESFRSICHFDDKGKYGDRVDVSALPKPENAKQQEARRLSVGKLEAMARRRGDVIRAINAIFPADDIPDVVKGGGATIPLHDALLKFSQKIVPLYESNPFDAKGKPLMPASTQSLARLVGALADSGAARDAMSRIWGRRGYRPFPVGLGAVRPALAYKDLRKLTTASLAVLGPEGTAVPELQQLLAVAKQEFITSQPVVAPLPAFKIVDAGGNAPNRSRTNIEVTAAILLGQDDSFAADPGEPKRLIALRDRRGFASIGGLSGSIPGPFVDLDGDGYADVDPSGRFIDGTGAPVAIDPPFFVPGVGAPSVAPFDPTVGAPYDYLDTSRTVTGAVARHLVPLVDPTELAPEGDPAPWASEHEALMYALSGAYVLYGPREQAEYDYTKDAPADQLAKAVAIPYSRFRAEDSPIPDLLHAAGQILGDKDSDVLLQSLIDLFEKHEPQVAALMGAALEIQDLGKQHDVALPYETPVWDEIAQVVSEIARRPGLVEGLLKSMAGDVIVSQQGTSKHMGETVAQFLENRDEMTYDPLNINGSAINLTVDPNGFSHVDPKTPIDPNKARSGTNRSCMQRSLQIIHDANGGPSCNKDGALVHIKVFGLNLTWPITGFPVFDTPYAQCELFQFDNLAEFYLNSLLPIDHPKRSILEIEASGLNFLLDTGSSLGLDADATFEASSGITGLTLHPDPFGLNRLVFFGAGSQMYPNMPDHDGHNAGGVTDNFVSSTIEPVSVSSCPKNGLGIPTCATQEGTLRIRDRNAIFLWEKLGFYDYLQPLVVAFANDPTVGDEATCKTRQSYKGCTGSRLFVELVDVLVRHWAGKDHGAECSKTGNAVTNKDYCSEAGISAYEPLLAKAFRTNLIPALHDFAKVAVQYADVTVARGPDKGKKLTGAQVLEKMTRILFDQDYAKSTSMVDRKGNAATQWVDGTAQPQVTGFTLFTDALHKIDTRFATACACDGKSGAELEACNGNAAACGADTEARRQQWKRARSLLVDEFLAVDGSGAGASFRNRSVPRTMTTVLKVLREQLNSPDRCGDREAGAPCVWAKRDLSNKLSDTLGGPMFAALMDVQEKVRQDPGARRALEAFLQYAMQSTSDGESLRGMLSSLSDILQVLSDDGNLAPIFNAISTAMSPDRDADGPGAADTTIKVLKALSSDDFDPYHVMDHVLPAVVTPMDDGSNMSPIEILMDVIADVNRIDASSAEPLKSDDYQTIMSTVHDFMVDDTRGLEQFYHIVQSRPRQ